MTNADYDLVIAGGGMVGSTLACALRDADLKIALLESAPLERIRPGEETDLRVSAINRASQRIFAAVGVWSGMIGEELAFPGCFSGCRGLDCEPEECLMPERQ